MSLERRLEKLEKALERFFEEHAPKHHQPTHTGPTLGGGAHGCTPITEFDAWFRLHFLKNG